MHRLLKIAYNFLTLAQVASRMEQVKEEKRQQVIGAMQHYKPEVLIRLVKDFYHLIKEDPSLFDKVAQYFANLISHLDKLPFTTTQKELCDKIFIILLDKTDDFTLLTFNASPIKLIEWWGSFLDPSLIREFTKRILQWLKDLPESDKWIVLSIIQNMVANPKLRPYINTTLFERVLSIHSPERLPAFDPAKRKFNTTNILAMLKGYEGLKKLDNLRYPQLLDIINKSTPQAQDLLRSVLWEEYGSQKIRKFRLDAENKPVDLESRPLELYGHIMPAHTSSFNQYDMKKQEERKQWHQVFNDFGIVPFIAF